MPWRSRPDACAAPEPDHEPPNAIESSRELRAVLRAWRWLALFAILTAVATYFGSRLQDKVYRGQATVRLVQGEQTPGNGTSDDLEILTSNYAELARSDRVFQAAATTLPGVSASKIKSASDVDSDEVSVLTLRSERPTAREAAAYANAYARGFAALVARDAENQRRAAVDRIGKRLKALRKRLDEAEQGGGEATALINEIQQLAARSADLSARQPDVARIIQSARVPDSPASPKPLRNAVIALFIALILGAAVVYLRSTFSGRYDSSEALAQDLDLPVLGELPRAKADQPAARDAFRALRTNLEFALSRPSGGADSRGARRDSGGGGMPPRSPALRRAGRFLERRGGSSPQPHAEPQGRNPVPILLVTSPEPGAGKTYVTIGLSRALSAAGEHTLVVDGDLRQPTMHERLGLTLEPGLAGVVDHSGGDIPARPVELGADGERRGGTLHAVTAGRRAEDSAELLSSGAVEDLLREAAASYDAVVVDSAPALGIADAAVLTRFVDGVVLVIDHKGTNRRRARRAKVALRAVGAPVVGVVLNRVPPRESAYYQYGYQEPEATKEPA